MKHSRMTAATAAFLLLGAGVLSAAGPVAGASAALPTYHVTMKVSQHEAIVGETDLTLSGKVTPQPPKDSKVLVQLQYQGRDTWLKVGKATVKANGSYRFVTTPTNRKDVTYRVMKAADKVAKQDTSRTRDVKVWGWVYLSAMTPSATTDVLTGTLPINGETYKESLYTDRTVAKGFVEYTLGHHCKTLDTTFGLSDRTETGGRASITLTADGTIAYQRTFDLGVSDHQLIDVTDVYRIRLDFAQVTDTPQTEPAAGSARVLTD